MSDIQELEKAIAEYKKASIELDETVTKAVIRAEQIRQEREASQSHPG